MTPPPKLRSSLWYLGLITLVVFAAELQVMFVLRFFVPHLVAWAEILLDSVSLVILLLPPLFFFVARPMERRAAAYREVAADLEAAREELERRVAARTAELQEANAALQESERLFRSLFENSPAPLWEEDFSPVVAYLDELRRSGVKDFRAYFEAHPEAVSQCAAQVKILDLNQAALKLYQAKSTADFLNGLDIVFTEESLPTFREELLALAEGKTRFESEAVNRTLAGDKIRSVLTWSVAPGHETTYSLVFVSTNDITEREQAEQALLEANQKLANWVGELEQHNREMALLGEMGDLLQKCITVEEASAVISDVVGRLFSPDSGAVFMVNASRSLVEAVAAWGEAPPSEQAFAPGDCWALRRGRTHLVEDTRSGVLCPHARGRAEAGASLCVPMMAQGETLGLLHVWVGLRETTPDGGRELESKQRLTASVADHLSLALANLKLRESLRLLSIRDPLTSLFNRRYMEESLEREMRRAERSGAALGLIMLDIDHFKRFNDTFGHDAGDALLRELGVFLQRQIRAGDIACRYGGEEFTLLLPEASLETARRRAEQLREAVKELRVQHSHRPLGAITLSLGVAVFPEHGSTGSAVLQAADAALYRAKQAGRDRVEAAG